MPLAVLGLSEDLRQYLLAKLPSLDLDQITTVSLDDLQIKDPQRPMLLVRPAGGPDADGDFGRKRLSVFAICGTYDEARRLHAQARLALLAYPYQTIAAGEPQDVDYALAEGISRPTSFCDYFVMTPANTPA